MNGKYKELSDKAYMLHTENKFDEAEYIYSELLKISPEDANILNLYGLLCISTGNISKAISLLTKAMVLNHSSYVAVNLAKAYLANNEPEKAIKLINDTIDNNSEDNGTEENNSEDDDLYYSLAIAYKKISNIEAAINAYLKALEINSENYAAAYNLALIYKDEKQIDNAIKYANLAQYTKNDDEDIYSLLSNLYEIKNDIEKAVKYLEKAAAINPTQYLYFYNLGVLYSKLNNKEKSIYYYNKVLEYNKNHTQSLVNLSSVFSESSPNLSFEYILKAYAINPNEKIVCLTLAQAYKTKFQNEESISILKRYLESNEADGDIYSLLAINYMDIGSYQQALDYYEKALTYDSENPNYLHGKASALKYLGHFDEAKSIMQNIVKNNPDLIQSSVTLGMMYLSEKNFYEGMNLYTLRSRDTKFYEIFKTNIWEYNSELKDKIVLVYSDCGLGDTIMFVRYIKILKQIAKDVILKTDKELISIFKYNFPDIKVIAKNENNPQYDIVIPIMNLPYALNLDFNHIPYSEGYLYDNVELTKKYSQIFKNETGKKIGLFWQGNKKIFKNRSVKTEIISKLTNTNNSYYSFQMNEIENIENVVSLKKHIKSYEDTASLLKNLDILVTIDSSIVHMAGALGIKTYLLLPKTPEWRWFNDDSVTPWYKSVEIFKQQETNNWVEVIERVANAIK